MSEPNIYSTMSMNCPLTAIRFCPGTEKPTQRAIPITTTKIYSRVEEVPAHLWDHNLPDPGLFLDKNYLLSLEQAMQDEMGFRYVFITDPKQPDLTVAFAYFQLVSFDVKKVSPYTDDIVAQSLWGRIKSKATLSAKALFIKNKINMFLCVC